MTNDYYTTAEAAKKHGCCKQRILALLAKHRIPGAKKRGVQWFIPKDFVVTQAEHRSRKMAKLPG